MKCPANNLLEFLALNSLRRLHRSPKILDTVEMSQLLREQLKQGTQPRNVAGLLSHYNRPWLRLCIVNSVADRAPRQVSSCASISSARQRGKGELREPTAIDSEKIPKERYLACSIEDWCRKPHVMFLLISFLSSLSARMKARLSSHLFESGFPCSVLSDR